jgi:hypothetical protein
MCELTLSHVARGILDYLRSHPEAQDTIAGIAEWWLPKGNVKTPLKDVESALEELVAKELVIERTSRDFQIHYRMNVDRLREIDAVLDGLSHGPASESDHSN